MWPEKFWSDEDARFLLLALLGGGALAGVFCRSTEILCQACSMITLPFHTHDDTILESKVVFKILRCEGQHDLGSMIWAFTMPVNTEHVSRDSMRPTFVSFFVCVVFSRCLDIALPFNATSALAANACTTSHPTASTIICSF